MTEKKCKRCGNPAEILHHDPDSDVPNRTVCGCCQGKANRKIMDGRRSMFDTPAAQSRRGETDFT